MNMGGPTDHWYPDIFTWERPAFGEPIDSLIRDIHRFGGDSLLQDDQPLALRLWQLWPQWGHVDDQALIQLAADLVPVRNSLRADAEARGWEVELCGPRHSRTSLNRPQSGMTGRSGIRSCKDLSMWPRRSEHRIEQVFTDEDREAQLCDLELLCSALADAFEAHGEPRASELFRTRAVTTARLLSEGWTQGDLNELGGEFPLGAWWLHPKVADYDATREARQDEVARQHARALATASDLRAIATLYRE